MNFFEEGLNVTDNPLVGDILNPVLRKLGINKRFYIITNEMDSVIKNGFATEPEIRKKIRTKIRHHGGLTTK